MSSQNPSELTATVVLNVNNGTVIRCDDLKLSHLISGFDFELGTKTYSALKNDLQFSVKLTNPKNFAGSISGEGTFTVPDDFKPTKEYADLKHIKAYPDLVRTDLGGSVSYRPVCLLTYPSDTLQNKSFGTVRSRNELDKYCQTLCSLDEAGRALIESLPGLEPSKSEKDRSMSTWAVDQWRKETITHIQDAAAKLNFGCAVKPMTEGEVDDLMQSRRQWIVAKGDQGSDQKSAYASDGSVGTLMSSGDPYYPNSDLRGSF